jgi:class 3 adenylate cyclase/pimeloyl-ACP methyl ester carboxylesterase
MDPRIQYAKTSDDVSIAFWTLGEGPPVIDLGTPPASHVLMEWQLPEMRRWYERFTANHQFVRIDSRGVGLSDRVVTDYSLDALILDVEAVVQRLDISSFTLFGSVNSSPIALAYAARHPGLISRLLLWCPYTRGVEFFDDTGTQALRMILEKDWSMFTETASHSRFGWVGSEFASRFANLWRSSVTPEMQARLMDVLHAVDVTTLLPKVTAPTLVLQREERGADIARRIAASVPDARVALFKGSSAAPYLDDADQIWKVMAEFLGEETAAQSGPAAVPGIPTGTAVILFADIVDSTALTERLGDTGFRDKARGLDGALRAVIRENIGIAIEGKLLGDGVLAVFTSARQAIEAALACGRAGEAGGLPLHLGIHAGDVIREEGNVYGGAVNIAARIASAAAPGEVLVSDTVRGLARTSAGVSFEDRGEHKLKGVSDAVRIWAVMTEH